MRGVSLPGVFSRDKDRRGYMRSRIREIWRKRPQHAAYVLLLWKLLSVSIKTKKLDDGKSLAEKTIRG